MHYPNKSKKQATEKGTNSYHSASNSTHPSSSKSPNNRSKSKTPYQNASTSDFNKRGPVILPSIRKETAGSSQNVSTTSGVPLSWKFASEVGKYSLKASDKKVKIEHEKSSLHSTKNQLDAANELLLKQIADGEMSWSFNDNERTFQ